MSEFDQKRQNIVETAQARCEATVLKRLGWQTLETRNSDNLDFHTVSAAGMKDMLQLAFRAGLDAGMDVAKAVLDGKLEQIAKK